MKSLVNIGPYLRVCLAGRYYGLSEAEHWVEAKHEEAADRVWLMCRCGWRHSLVASALLRLMQWEGERHAAEVLRAPAQEHLDEERRKLQPTLADFTDWGWFHVEAA